jgi:UDP-2-acetamido-2-deoxy-ribo-hexuluronate aminotransferase
VSRRVELAINAVIENDPSIYPIPLTLDRQLSPRGIIGVDLFGLPAGYDPINETAEKNDLFIIEDALNPLGQRYAQR